MPSSGKARAVGVRGLSVRGPRDRLRLPAATRVRSVIDQRSSGVGAIACCQRQRASPFSA